MKIVKLEIDENSILAGIDAMALVEAPAIQEDFYYFASQKFEETYNDYPEAAVEAAKQGIIRNEKTGNKCATQVGKVRAQQLANREPVSLDTVRRMRAFLIRQKDNYVLATNRRDYNACGYISYLLWGGPAALPWTEKILRQNDEEFAKVGPRGGIAASPKAPKSDTPNPNPKGEGTAGGSAASSRGAEVDAKTEESLQKKADEFNEKYKEKLGYGVNIGALKSVYQRGLGAYNTSRSPSVAAAGGAKQWAMARVNAFLFLVKSGRPQNRNYTTDYDLLPKGHPKRKEFKQIMESIIAQKMIEQMMFADMSEMISFDYHDTLNTERGTELAKELIAEGYDVHVISGANDVEELYPLTRELGIPDSKVHAVGSNKAKIELINSLPIIKHYDNNLDVIEALGDVGYQFELVVSGLPNFINEPTERLKINKEASYGFSAIEEQQMVVGPAMIPNKLIKRRDENGEEYFVYFTEDTIRKIAYKMMADKVIDKVNIEHDGNKFIDGAYLVESWIVEDPLKDKSLVYGFLPLKGTWMTMYKIEDKKIFNEYIKSGKVKGFSIEGFFESKTIN